jgi:hypothetical protein
MLLITYTDSSQVPNGKCLAWGFSHLRSASFTRDCMWAAPNIAHSITSLLIGGVFRCRESRLLLHCYSPMIVEHVQGNVQDWNLQCPSNSIWPFKIYLIQNSLLKRNPQLENEDVTWSPRYNMPVPRTNKRRALSAQEVELDDWFLILHVVP